MKSVFIIFRYPPLFKAIITYFHIILLSEIEINNFDTS